MALSPQFSTDRTLAEFAAWCEYHGWDVLEYLKVSPVHIPGSWHYLHKAADICLVGKTDRATFQRLLQEVYPEAQRRGLAVTFPAETNGYGVPNHSIGDSLHVHVDLGEWSNLGHHPEGEKAPWTGHDQGLSAAEVTVIQKDLGITADGVCGLVTLKAIAAEQKKLGVTVDAVWGPKTAAAFAASQQAPKPPVNKPPVKKPPVKTPVVKTPVVKNLRTGSKGAKVKELQELLNRKYPAYSHLVADGRFGARTAAVIREFQKRSHLHVDGIVGPATAKALGLHL